MNSSDFDDAVSGFYAAASGRKVWRDALSTFQEVVAADAIHFWSLDLSKGRFGFSHLCSPRPTDAEVDYITKYHLIDPRTRYPIEGEVNEWFNCWEHFSDEYVAASPFYQEFLIPHGGRYVSALKLRHDGDQVLMLGVHRGINNKPMNADELVVCKRLARHLADAADLHSLTRLRTKQAMLGIELLERLRAAVVLLDENRTIVHLNPAARQFLASSSALSESGVRLHCYKSEDDANLLVGLHRLLDAGSMAGEGNDKLFLRVTDAEQIPVGLFLYALRPERTLGMFGEKPMAMMLIHRPGDLLEFDPFVVAAVYDLTPGEARVAVCAARGSSAAEISRQWNVSIHTVRTQLKSVFSKTGVARQSELVSVLSALPMVALGLT